MRIFESKILFFCTLFVYGVILTVGVLWFRFPTEKVERLCEVKIEELVKGSQCKVAGIGYGFPFSVAVKSVRFNDEQQQELFTLRNIRLSPSLKNVGSQFGLKFDGFGGTHSLQLTIDSDNKEFVLEKIKIKNLDPAKIPVLARAAKREIRGTIDGEGIFHGVLQGGKLLTDGKGRFTLKQGKFPLLVPILSLESIDLKKFSMELDFKNNILECQKGKFHGRELDGNFSGTVTMQSSLQDTRLSFVGNLEPLPDLLKGNKEAQEMVIQLQKKRKRGALPFVLKGTVQKPIFTFEP